MSKAILLISILSIICTGGLLDGTYAEQFEIVNAMGEKVEMETNCALYVNGTDISNDNYVHLHYNDRYAELPLVGIFNELGATIEWKSETYAEITYSGKLYFLDTVQSSLVRENDWCNMIALPPGTTHETCYYSLHNDFIVDSDSMRICLRYIGFDLTIDYEASAIYIKAIN